MEIKKGRVKGKTKKEKVEKVKEINCHHSYSIPEDHKLSHSLTTTDTYTLNIRFSHNLEVLDSRANPQSQTLHYNHIRHSHTQVIITAPVTHTGPYSHTTYDKWDATLLMSDFRMLHHGHTHHTHSQPHNHKHTNTHSQFFPATSHPGVRTRLSL